MSGANERKTRSIETSIDLPADIEAVWKALTDAEELTRWFPLEARVKPGEGGQIWMSWRGEWSQAARIDLWRECEQLRLVIDAPPAKDGEPVQFVIDHHLEAKKGGSTILRLVHSGFGPEEDWDYLYDGTRRGWRFELRGLRHYLAHHRGRPRTVINVHRRFEGESLEEIWRRLMSAEVLLATGSVDGLREGDRYDITTATGDRLRGTVHINQPPLDFCATVEDLNDALLRVRIDGSYDARPGREMNLWLSTYGLDEAALERIEERWERLGDAVAERSVNTIES